MASVATRMHVGSPGATIVEMSRACRVDLVAVGSRGLGPYKGYLLGSVSDHVANHARCSVLLAKTPPKRSGRYLLAIDDSRYAVAVLRWLRELDLSKGAWIHLVKVFRSMGDFPDPEGVSGHAPATGPPPRHVRTLGGRPGSAGGDVRRGARHESRPGDRGGPFRTRGPGDPGVRPQVRSGTAGDRRERALRDRGVPARQRGAQADRSRPLLGPHRAAFR